MRRLAPNQAPSYRLHKQSGQAIVTFDGRDFTLGVYGSPESREKYDRLVAQWFQNGRELPADGNTVAHVILAFWRHAEVYYRGPAGTPTGELDNHRHVLRVLRKLFGGTPAAVFGPKSLKAVREELIRRDWSRTYINRQIDRLKHVFKWATEEELVPPSVNPAPPVARPRCARGRATA